MEFQTKELDAVMQVFHVVDGRIRAAGDVVEHGEGAWDEATLVRTTRLRATPLSATLSLHIACEACAPIVVLDGRYAAPELTTHHPECAFAVRFQRGRLASCRAVKLQTREELRSALARRFVRVLDDDDPVAAWARRSWRPWSSVAATDEDAEVDDLDEMIDAFEAESPGFRPQVEAQTELRLLVHFLRQVRKETGLTRADVARRMGVEAKRIAALEGGEDVQATFLLRYLNVLGIRDVADRLLDG